MSQIQKAGRANDLFMEQLAKLMPKKAETEAKVEETPKEEQLEKDREEKGQEAEADKITETQLKDAGERKDEPIHDLPEKQLEKSRSASRNAAPNAKGEGITEQRLNEASKDSFPHRNEKAWKRTENKRPINALREEMGNASDEAKRERYEKANTSGKKRLVDEDISSQKTNKTAQVKSPLPGVKPPLPGAKPAVPNAANPTTPNAANPAHGSYNKTLPLGEVDPASANKIQVDNSPALGKPQQPQQPQQAQQQQQQPQQQMDENSFAPQQEPQEADWHAQVGQVGQAVGNAADNMLGWLGKAKPAVAFNLKRQKLATQKKCEDYIAYKNVTEGGVKTASLGKFAEVKELDSIMSGIMQAALDDGRELTHDDLAKIAALKDRKSDLLIKG